MLSTAAGEHPFDWEYHLRRLCLAYNTSVHPTTGHTPFFLMFGRQVRMPVDVMFGTPTPQPSTVPQYAADLRASLEAAYRCVRERMGRKLERQKELYDRKAHGVPLVPGDLVWLHNPAVARGQSKKLHRPWTGPYRVVRRLLDAVYRLQHTQARRKRPVVHFDRLKPCPPTCVFLRTLRELDRGLPLQPQPRLLAQPSNFWRVRILIRPRLGHMLRPLPGTPDATVPRQIDCFPSSPIEFGTNYSWRGAV